MPNYLIKFSSHLHTTNAEAQGCYDSLFAKEGCFTVRRSEQVLMRNTKTSGGLARGRVVTDNVIARWICAMPSSANVIDATEKFYGILAGTSEQFADIHKMLEWHQSHYPFNDSTN